MTSSAMSDLSNLIERLEKATGPDRALDLMIAEATGHKTYHGTTPVISAAPAYTASLDEAITLVPARCKDWDWRVRNATDFKVNLYFPSAEKLEVFGGRSNVFAIAICIAALKAREAKG